MSFIISNNGLLMLSTVIMKFFFNSDNKKKTFWKNKLENKARDGNLSTTDQFLINKLANSNAVAICYYCHKWV